MGSDECQTGRAMGCVKGATSEELPEPRSVWTSLEAGVTLVIFALSLPNSFFIVRGRGGRALVYARTGRTRAARVFN